MAHLFGKFVWFEHLSGDVEGARRFYDGLFGWNSSPLPMGDRTYPMIRNGEEGIGGFRESPPGTLAMWMGYLSVPDVDVSAAQAAAAGARVLMPPTDFGPVGRGASLADPGNAVFSIWKGAEGDRPDAMPIAVGDWYWNELMTREPEAALSFYEGVFGFSHESMEMPDKNHYHLLLKDGVPRGGLMKSPRPEMPNAWLPYIRVADCDASVERAGKLGGRIAVAPRDAPGVGRFAVLVDPQGAVLGVIRGDR